MAIADSLIHHWDCSLHVCCPRCRSFYWHCPACGTPLGRRLTVKPIEFPSTGACECAECGARGVITLLGWSPAVALQQSFELPAAQSPQPPAQSREDRDERLSVNEWRRAADPALLLRLRGVSAGDIGEAHLRLGGEIHHKPTRSWGYGAHQAYTRSELIAALNLIDRQQGGRGHD